MINTENLTAERADEQGWHVSNCPLGFTGDGSCPSKGKINCLINTIGGDYRTCKVLPSNKDKNKTYELLPGGRE